MIVFPESTPVEIQVRTQLQDAWAQISEKLGDVWGRGLRYGEGPDLPDAPVRLGSATTRREVVENLLTLADAIDQGETHEVLLAQLQEEMLAPNRGTPEELRQRFREITHRAAVLKNNLQQALDRLLEETRQLGGPP